MSNLYAQMGYQAESHADRDQHFTPTDQDALAPNPERLSALWISFDRGGECLQHIWGQMSSKWILRFMNILFLSRWFPYPTNNGSKLRIYNLVRGLARHHDVTLLSFADQPNVRSDVPEMQKICFEVQVVPWREFNPYSARAWVGFLSFKPRSLIDTFSAEMAGKIIQSIKKRKYDLIIASQLSMAAYRPYFGNIPAIFEEVEIGLSLGKARQSLGLKERMRSTVTHFKLHRYLSHLLSCFRTCTVVSEKERQLLLQNFPKYIGAIEVIPNCVQVGEYDTRQVTSKTNQLIFSGSFQYHVNYDAMLWFIRKVYYKVLEQVPDVHLVITGDHANLPFPPAPNVMLAGYVDDINALIASSKISIAPLLSGGGTRLKIIEAMAIGTPVVTTSKGAEGLAAISGVHLLVADSPNEFADAVVSVLKDDHLSGKLSTNGKLFVKENYDWQSVMPRFLQLVEDVGSS
jgi:glycosyltransferase involved in cell wall biosynthesis